MPSNILAELLALDDRERRELAAALTASLPSEERQSLPLSGRLTVRDRPMLEGAVRGVVGDLTETPPADIDMEGTLYAQGVDSLRLIVLRERLHAEIGVVFSDDEWMATTTPGGILEHALSSAVTPIVRPGVIDVAGPEPQNPGGVIFARGVATEPLEIGMPLTGRNNLAETPLLQYLGDQRWRHLSRVLDVPTRNIVDEDGERLYATFFYVEVAFPADRPMAAFGENDRFKVISTLGRYGASMLDGVSYLVPEGHSLPAAGTDAPFSSMAEANGAGVPAVRLSNIFVKKFDGAAWLKKGRLAHERLALVPEFAEPPDAYTLAKTAELTGHFEFDPAGWTAMTDGPVEREYRLVPDRDLNGVGLVYFANYPMFLDICERDVLSTADPALTEDLIDRRTLVRRQSAYLNNASSQDTLRVELEPWCRAARRGRGDTVDLHIHVDARMSRRSDNRLMMVSGAHKVVRDIDASALPVAVRPIP